jgi:MFS family permease
VFAACAPLFMLSQYYRVLNAVIAQDLERDLGLGSEALGRLSAAFFYGFAATQIPLALVLDRLGARRAMAALSLLGAGGALVFATARTPGAALLGEVLLGVGMAANLVGSMKLVGHWFQRGEFATVVGAFVALGTFGNILGTTPLALLVRAVGWRGSLALAAAVTAVCVLAFVAAVRERPPGAASAGTAAAAVPVAAGLRRLLGTRDYWLISFGAFCRYGAYSSLQALWVGPFLVEVVRLSPVRAANVMLLLNLSFVAGAPLGGWLSDRVLRSRKIPVLLALGGISAAVLALALLADAPAVLPVAGTLVFLGVIAGFGQLVYPHIRDLLPGEMAGMAMAGVNFFNMLGAAAFVHGAGWILERRAGAVGIRGPAGYRAAFLVVAGVVALAFLLYGLTRDARVRALGAHGGDRLRRSNVAAPP